MARARRLLQPVADLGDGGQVEGPGPDPLGQPPYAADHPVDGVLDVDILHFTLIPVLLEKLMLAPEGMKMAVNYGLDSVRFIQPVKVDSRVRLAAKVLDITEKRPGQWLIKIEATLEIEGQDKPAYIAESLSLCFV